MNDPKFMNCHPLGEVIVDRKQVGVANPSFKYHDAQIMREPADPTKMLMIIFPEKDLQEGPFDIYFWVKVI